MGAVILGVVWQVLGWFFSTVAQKALIMGAVYILITELMPVIWSHVPGADDLNNLFYPMSSGFWYFWDWGQMSTGISLVLSASITRFAIRRIPFM